MNDKDVAPIEPTPVEAEVVPPTGPDVLFPLNIEPVNKQKINSVEPPENADL